MTLLIAVDTETTGIPARGEVITSPSYPRLVELAGLLVEVESEREVAMFSFIISPAGYEVPAESASIHGITHERASAQGVPVAVALSAYLNLRARADELVGHNVTFDLGIIASELHRSARRPSHPGPSTITCTADLGTPVARLPPTERMIAAGYGGNFKKPNLGELYLHLFGEPFIDAHSALADCRAAVRCLFEMRRRRACPTSSG